MTGVYTVEKKGVVIGAGRPGILVSAQGRSAPEILASVSALSAAPGVTGIEVRLDYLDSGRNSDEIAELSGLLEAAYRAAGEKLLVATVRTRAEGGEAAFTDPEYARLVGSLINLAPMDLVDIEADRGDDLVRALVKVAHEKGVGVIMSHHDFKKTPKDAELRATLEKEKALGGDILKLAVMPEKPSDVARLLLVTAQAREAGLSPLVTMSMGPLGSVSRVSGEVFGSAFTFAMTGKASAPGQLAVEEVVSITRALSPVRGA